MIRWLLRLTTVFVLSAQAQAQIANGSFESWSGGSPVGWTTIDSGISVSSTSSQVYSGSYSSAIYVNTKTQASTDFRQTISVVSGVTYNFSVKVYHTEGSLAVRLYVDGYQNYSAPSTTGQWQTLSYTYTPSSTGTIEIGLRFYDQSGFDGSELVYIDDYSMSSGASDGTDSGSGGDSGSGTGGTDSTSYYAETAGLSGYTLKTALSSIISSGYNEQSYGSLWNFYSSYELDRYYEKDATIIDIYSESPSGSDPYSYTPVSDQCGSYSGEGSCYNREHSFPRSWFGGAVAPMNTDVHHIYPSDGYVNAVRSSYPYGEVGSASYTSRNGSKLGTASSGLGYSGTVFEPIDEFKGDLARSYFYMATRYQGQISSWQSNSTYGNAVLDGSSDKVYETWFLNMLISWHEQDPVSQKEIDRNEAAYSFQGNRNPFVDHPEYVSLIWE